MSATEPEATICTRLVADVAGLCRAGRVMAVLDTAGSLHVAAHRLSAGETDAALLQAITPWRVEARRSGKARLRHGPQGASAHPQRSCIVVPLRNGRERLGFFYADIGGHDGRFAATQRDLLAALAGHAAAALSQARRAQAWSRQLGQRASELALVNSIQQGMAAKLDFQGIVDGVGDTLREVFATGNLSILWWDAALARFDWLYACEHDRRLQHPPLVPRAGGFMARWGEAPRTVLGVPMLAGERLLGVAFLENHERNHAFAPPELRLLETIAKPTTWC